MDQYPIKSVTFGGFDKQDVINYIETLSRESAAAQERLRKEADALRKDLDDTTQKLQAELEASTQELQQKLDGTARELQEKLDASDGQLEKTASELETLRRERDKLREENTRLQTELTQERSVCQHLRQELERLRPLEAEADGLRADAQAYAQFRERIGGIECEARKRADDLERATAEQLCRTVAQFQEQYQALLSTFKSTASYVTGELRKVEVNLTQLPHAMDPATDALSALADRLESKTREERPEANAKEEG